MKCPACGNKLTEKLNQEMNVDVCEGGCGGVWFDHREMSKVDEPHEFAGEEILMVAFNPATQINPSEKRDCPQCEDIVMMRRFFSVKRSVQVDECASCGGIWLDTGELKSIRAQFNSEEERNQAAEQMFGEIFGKELGEMERKSKEQLASARKVAHALRLICPSYWIPGKQKGAAF